MGTVTQGEQANGRDRIPPSPFDSPAVRRAEWRRFAIAVSMVGTMLAEVALVWVFSWFTLWVWLALIALQYAALARANKDVAATRKRALDAYFTALQSAPRRPSS